MRNLAYDICPILFFNEADAIINKRSNNTDTAVDKMENACQNIILQAMENLSGIMIATTRCAGSCRGIIKLSDIMKGTCPFGQVPF